MGFEQFLMLTKWKTRFWSVFHVFKMKAKVFQAFFMFTKWKTQKKRFLCLPNSKKTTFLFFTALQRSPTHRARVPVQGAVRNCRKKEKRWKTRLQRFSFLQNRSNMFEAFSFLQKKKCFWSVYYILTKGNKQNFVAIFMCTKFNKTQVF